MFQLIVCSFDEANGLIDRGFNPTRIVSLVEPGLSITQRGEHHLIVRLDDITVARWNGEVVAFTADLTDDDCLIVHCMAGISRSTAMATAILIQHGVPYHCALKHVQTIRACLDPNALLIKLIDQHFGFDGKYITHFKEWSRRNAFAVAALPRTNHLVLPGDLGGLPDEILKMLPKEI